MVSSIYVGRLGNILFEKAATIGYAQRHGLRYCIDEEPSIADMWPKPVFIREKGHAYQELPFKPEWHSQHVVLQGFWQSEKYFAHCREEVLKAFGYDWSLKEGWCSIHVRRGDYLLYPDKHPVISEYYIGQAVIKIMAQNINRFLVFSDDLAWCKNIFKNWPYYLGAEFKYSEGRTPEEDLVLGSCCEHNIISNSTFSWWQAWLGRNKNKIVISPSKDNWFGPGNSNLCTDDIIPDEWIQIKY